MAENQRAKTNYGSNILYFSAAHAGLAGYRLAEAGGKETIKNLEPEARKDALPSIRWENDKQKARCYEYLDKINENFLKARDFSIQGDPCTASDHAKIFLSLVEQCQQDCPEDFLERSGYHKGIIKNLNTIFILGEKKCKYRK
jgi:hypothetical protein